MQVLKTIPGFSCLSSEGLPDGSRLWLRGSATGPKDALRLHLKRDRSTTMKAYSQDNPRILVSFVRGPSRWIPPLAAWVRNRSQGCAALALESYRGGDLTLAETHYQEALLWQPDDAELHSALGQVYYEHSQPAEAEQQFRKALDCNYGNLRALKGLGILLQEQGGFSEAMYLYLRYLELEPKDAPVCYNLGLVFHNLGNYEKANEYYERAEKEDPEDLLTRKNRAIVLADRKSVV